MYIKLKEDFDIYVPRSGKVGGGFQTYADRASEPQGRAAAQRGAPTKHRGRRRRRVEMSAAAAQGGAPCLSLRVHHHYRQPITHHRYCA